MSCMLRVLIRLDFWPCKSASNCIYLMLLPAITISWNVKQRCRNVLKHASIVTHLTSIMEDASHRLLDTREKSVTIGNGIDCSAWQAYAGLPEQDYLLGIG